jgi:hypothetical protein
MCSFMEICAECRQQEAGMEQDHGKQKEKEKEAERGFGRIVMTNKPRV